MTTALDQSLTTIQRLIHSCHQTRDYFRDAAEMLEEGTLKTLFGLYAQQRSRVAEELHSLGMSVFSEASGGHFRNSYLAATEPELLEACLQVERTALALYRGALAERSLPTKARFLISAQLALIERVHSRIQALAPATCGASEGTFQRVVL